MIDLLLLLLVLIWGINYSAVKAALVHFNPLAFNSLRFLIASLVLFVILKSRGRTLPKFGTDWKLVLFVGLLGNAIYQVIFIYGISWTRAGNTGLILASAPVFVALLSMALKHEIITPKMWCGIFASFLGVTLVVLGSAQSVGINRGSLHGDLTVLAGAVLWAVYIVASAPLVKRYGAIATSAATLWVGTPLLVAISFTSLRSQNWGQIRLMDWGALLYSAVFAIGIAQVVWYRAIGERGNARTSVYSNLVPLVGVLIAWALLGETPHLVQGIGALLILTGAFLTGIQGRNAESPKPMRFSTKYCDHG